MSLKTAKGCGEREEIGRIRKAGRRAVEAAEALIRTGVRARKGSGGRGSSPRRRQVETQRARSKEAVATGANRERGWSRWPNGRRSRQARERRSRPGPILERGRRKAGSLQARERPIRAAGSVREKHQKAAVSWEALILGLEKPASGERNSESPGAPGRSARCGACPWRARLGIESLGTIFFPA